MQRPKKSAKRSIGTIGVVEPQRESLYDILCHNLKQARKNIYVNRIIYLGEHSFEAGTITHVFRDIVKGINTSYNDEPLTGIFLHYQKYFVHMLEGSDDSIMKHFHLLTENEISNNFLNMKLVLAVHHINQRFVIDWMDIPGKPATLLEKIEPDCDMEKSGRYIFNCIQKVYQLCKEIRDEVKKKEDDDYESIELGKVKTPVFDHRFTEEVLKPYYPETNLLQFLVQTIFLKNLDEYINVHESPFMPDYYLDQVWPIHSTMVPYSIFDKTIELCLDLPTHKAEEMEEIVIDEEAQIEKIERS